MFNSKKKQTFNFKKTSKFSLGDSDSDLEEESEVDEIMSEAEAFMDSVDSSIENAKTNELNSAAVNTISYDQKTQEKSVSTKSCGCF